MERRGGRARPLEGGAVTQPLATSHQPPESDTPMTATYVRVLVFEAAILAALWFFGRMFS